MSANPNLSGIPTMYRGILFRSRNEAKWACVFDALLIPWEYEPCDLGNYIPDFMLHSSLLVEIKPELDDGALSRAKEKIERSGWPGESVILTPLVEQSAHQPLVGSFGEVEEGPDGLQLVWSDCRAMRCLSCGEVSLFPDSGSWRCRRCAADTGNAHVGDVGREFETAWSEAVNRVQWRAV